MEQLILAVRKYPCLWNTTAIEYRDQELKDAAWAEVMKETDLSSVKEVKLKWKKLRDSYRDALKRQSEMLAKEPGGAAKKNYPWKYMGLMQFLQPYMSNRKKQPESPPPQASAGAHNGDPRTDTDTESEPEPDQHQHQHQHQQLQPGKRKGADRLALIDRKLDYLCGQQRHPPPADTRRHPHPHPLPPDPLDVFFNSMCQSTKRLPFPTQIKIKKTLFSAVIEAEERLAGDRQTYTALWARPQHSGSSSDPEDEDRKPPC